MNEDTEHTPEPGQDQQPEEQPRELIRGKNGVLIDPVTKKFVGGAQNLYNSETGRNAITRRWELAERGRLAARQSIRNVAGTPTSAQAFGDMIGIAYKRAVTEDHGIASAKYMELVGRGTGYLAADRTGGQQPGANVAIQVNIDVDELVKRLELLDTVLRDPE